MYSFIQFTRCLSLSIYIYIFVFFKYMDSWQNQYILTNPAKKTDTSRLKIPHPHFPIGVLQPAELRRPTRGKFPKRWDKRSFGALPFVLLVVRWMSAFNVAQNLDVEPHWLKPCRCFGTHQFTPGLKNKGTTTTIMLLKTREGCVQRGWKWKLQFSSILRLRSGMKPC